VIGRGEDKIAVFQIEVLWAEGWLLFRGRHISILTDRMRI
jgi:hypothetical protein